MNPYNDPKVYGLARILGITVMQADIMFHGDPETIDRLIEQAKRDQENRIRNAERKLGDIEYYMNNHREK